MQESETISIAIVKNKRQKFLITRRQEGQHLAGKWEFPGGKVESGETFEVAMIRELKEEVGLIATDYVLFESLNFQYENLVLSLHFYLVNEFDGDATGLEGQQLKWVDFSEFKKY